MDRALLEQRQVALYFVPLGPLLKCEHEGNISACRHHLVETRQVVGGQCLSSLSGSGWVIEDEGP